MFGSLIPGGGPGQQGLNLLKQITAMQQPTASPGVAAPAAAQPAQPDWAGGGPNAINNGFLAKLMSGNPGGLIGALMNRSGQPDPNAPLPADWQGPMMAGATPREGMPQVGLMSRLFPQMGQFGGGSGAPRFNPGDLSGY